MNSTDVRTVVAAVLAGVLTAAGSFAAGGACAVVGLLAGAVMARSGFSSDESSVTGAILLGGLVVLLALPSGHTIAAVVALGVFAGTEFAALARSFADDSGDPATGRVTAVGSTILAGGALGAAVLVVGRVHAGATVTVAATAVLAAGAMVGLVAAFGRRARSEAATARRAAPDEAR
jgi:hypothetical protein